MTPAAPEPGAFALFACCLPVRGARRSVICDLQRQALHFIPNGLHEILTEHRGKTPAAIKQHYAHEYDEEIDEYFEFLLREELGFWCDDPESFPAIDLAWDPAERITNAILDVDAGSEHDYPAILGQLDDLGCKALEARFFHRCRLGELRDLLAAARHGRLRSIDLLAGYTGELTGEALDELAAAYQRVSTILIHSAPPALCRRWTLERLGTEIEYVTQAIDSPRCCGQVHPGYFAVNLDTFAEARRFNSCLHRKLAVDARGEIRNCPSLPRSFGNVRDVSLHSALAHRDFPELWAINKDQIAVCKDCEFRYVCTDCRAYLSHPGDRYAKPAKCGYDPYTATWQSPAAATAAGRSEKGEAS
jgi:SPASM domain peptide maturase of grasp-with-spasm system